MITTDNDNNNIINVNNNNNMFTVNLNIHMNFINDNLHDYFSFNMYFVSNYTNNQLIYYYVSDIIFAAEQVCF